MDQDKKYIVMQHIKKDSRQRDWQLRGQVRHDRPAPLYGGGMETDKLMGTIVD